MPVGAYTKAPPLAWAGWRLRVPGGPPGGQYHGYLGDLSGRGIVLREGETLTDYVYRAPGEMRPRPNASGGAQTVREYQTRRHAGQAVAPGSFLGLVDPLVADGSRGSDGGGGMVPDDGWMPNDIVAPLPGEPWPKWQKGPLPGYPWPTSPIYFPEDLIPSHGSGATSVVTQPPPTLLPTPPAPAIYDFTVPPISPRPAPTVAAKPSDFLPSQGQTLETWAQPLPPSYRVEIGPDGQYRIVVGQGAGQTFADWMEAETIWTGVKNKWVTLGGVIVGALILRGRR